MRAWRARSSSASRSRCCASSARRAACARASAPRTTSSALRLRCSDAHGDSDHSWMRCGSTCRSSCDYKCITNSHSNSSYEKTKNYTQTDTNRTLICDYKTNWLWVRSPLEEMKYLLKFIFPFLRSGVKVNRGIEFCHSTRNAFRIRQKMRNGVS